ncbi:MAG: UV DNA damage repair endonuclease UvsE [Thermodesulfobacteriota bacterium]
MARGEPVGFNGTMIRFGLCCLFTEEPIRFRTTTAKALAGRERQAQLCALSALCLANAENLRLALQAVQRRGIGAFRVTSPLFPRFTHPEVGYTLADLPEAAEIAAVLGQVREFGRKHHIRLSLHPDQFVVLSSPRAEVVANARRELEYHGFLAEQIGAEVITLHAGGGYGDKGAALARFAAAFATLSDGVQQRLALENDDHTYAPADLLPLCKELGIPFVYDVHHHRCLPDTLSVEEASQRAAASWQRLGREPWFHLSSPKNGWQGGDPKPHADCIDPADFPACWQELGCDVTVDVEAKAKELAVVRLMAALGARPIRG